MGNILARIDEALEESATYRQHVSHGAPMDTPANEGLPLPPHLANTLAVMTGLDVQVVDAFVELTNKGKSIAAAAAESGLSVGQAMDLKGAMVDVGLKPGTMMAEESDDEAVVEARRTADFLYRLAEAAEEEQDAADLIEEIVGNVKASLGEGMQGKHADVDVAYAGLVLVSGMLLDMGMESEAGLLEKLKRKLVSDGKANRAKAAKLGRLMQKALVTKGLANESLDEGMPETEPYLSPDGGQKYIDMKLPRDATRIAQEYATAIVDNLPSSHPGRLTASFGQASGDAVRAVVEGQDEDGNKLVVSVDLAGSPPKMTLNVAGLGSMVEMKIDGANWMAAVPAMMQHVVRAFVQPGYRYTEAG